MKGALLRLYTRELQVCEARPLHTWLLEHARDIGIEAGAVFRTAASYGTGVGLSHDESIDEEVGALVVVEFNVAEGDVTKLLQSLANGRFRIPYSVQAMEWSRGEPR